jgi:hypothetical protein
VHKISQREREGEGEGEREVEGREGKGRPKQARKGGREGKKVGEYLEEEEGLLQGGTGCEGGEGVERDSRWVIWGRVGRVNLSMIQSLETHHELT